MYFARPNLVLPIAVVLLTRQKCQHKLPSCFTSKLFRLNQRADSADVPIQTSLSWQRRSVLSVGTLLLLEVIGSHVVRAEEEIQPAAVARPFAPVDALLPAVKVKAMIDRAAYLTATIVNEEKARKQRNAIDELEELLLRPQNFTSASDELLSSSKAQPAKQYLDSYKRNVDQLSILEKPGALLVQSGEIGAWQRLKRQERTREEADEVRAAFNTYTNKLSFAADSYRLNVPKRERSEMIREDRLPDVKTVIVADMDLRYLYRNQVLTALDDARAELRFQLQEPKFDGKELSELLLAAQTACGQWFSFIDAADIADAYKALGLSAAEGGGRYG